MKNLNERVVWITGASSGIGRAAAAAFVAEGAFVIVSARRAELLHELATELGEDRVHVLPVDLTASGAVEQAVEDAYAWKGRVDVLINNAGISQRSLAIETSMDVIRRVMEINFFAQVELANLVGRRMREAGSGNITVVTSVTGHVSTPLRSAYAASKHALHGYFDAMRAELVEHNVHVTLVVPGYVQTEIAMKAVTGDGSELGRLEQAHGKGISPEKCAAAMVRGVKRAQREVLVGGPEVASIYIKRFAPGLLYRLLPRAVPK